MCRTSCQALSRSVVERILIVTSALRYPEALVFVIVHSGTAEEALDRHTIARQVGDQRLLAESLELVAPVADELVASFYNQLFTEYPQVRPMFPARMDGQREKLLKAIIALVTHYDRPEQLIPALTAMGRQHEEYGVRIDHYAAVGLTLLSTLRRFAGAAWNADYEGAWLRAYTFAAGTMMRAGVLAMDEFVPLEENLAAA